MAKKENFEEDIEKRAEKFEKEFEEKAEEFGKRAEDWGKKIEKKWSGGKKGKTAEYVANIIVNVILILIWGRLPEWFPFITNSFTAILPLFYISFFATLIANLIFLISGEWFIVSLLKFMLNIFSIVVMVSLYYIFPFDFSAYTANWALITKILILISIGGILIGTITEFTKTICCKK